MRSLRGASTCRQSLQSAAALPSCTLLRSHEGNCLRITDQVVVMHQKRVVVLGEEAPQRVDVAFRTDEQSFRFQPSGLAIVVLQHGDTVASEGSTVMPIPCLNHEFGRRRMRMAAELRRC